MSQTPAGWYPQGSAERYWDGTQWTGHTRPMPQQQAFVPVAPHVAKKAKKPIFLRWWFLAIAAVVVLAIAGSALSGGGSEDAVTTSPAADETSSAAATPKASTKNPAKKPGVGTPVKDGKFQFTVTKITRGKTQIGSADFGTKAQGEYIFVYVTIKNVGNEAQLFDGSSQFLFNAAGQKFSSDGEAGLYLDKSESFLNEINPGNTVKGIVVFDVPKGTKPAKVELHDSPFSGGVDVTL